MVDNDWSHVLGGTDGATAWLDGPTVSEAIHLAGRESLERATHDPLWIRRASAGDWGLASSGVCCSRAAATDAWNAWGDDIHRYGDGSEVAGISKDFNVVPVDGWAPHMDGVALFLSLGSNRGGPILEVQSMEPDAFRDLHVRDSQLGHGEGMVKELGLVGEGETPSDDSEEPVHGDIFGFGESSAAPEVEVVEDESWKELGFGDENEPKR